MWAGTHATYHKPIRVGEMIKQVSIIEAVTPKVGKTGPLVFLKLKHEISGEDGLATTELQDVVYREEAAPGAVAPLPPPAPGEAVWKRAIHPTPVLLFRYSALTFNSHRIHYDVDYCRDVEGYPGLVFHGPLTATLLLDLASRHSGGKIITDFSYRAISPLFDINPFTIALAHEEDRLVLWAETPEGHLAMSATAKLKEGN